MNRVGRAIVCTFFSTKSTQKMIPTGYISRSSWKKWKQSFTAFRNSSHALVTSFEAFTNWYRIIWRIKISNWVILIDGLYRVIYFVSNPDVERPVRFCFWRWELKLDKVGIYQTLGWHYSENHNRYRRNTHERPAGLKDSLCGAIDSTHISGR